MTFLLNNSSGGASFCPNSANAGIDNTIFGVVAPHLRLVELVTKMAALFHDLGKASALFQLKLRGAGRHFEPLRHELVSYLIVLDALVPGLFDGTSSETTDTAWLTTLSTDPCRIFAGTNGNVLSAPMVDRARALAVRGHSPDLFPGPFVSGTLKTSAPLLCSVLWLVLSHHKLPGFQNATASVRSHVNQDAEQPFTEDDIALNLRLAVGQLPWESQQWLELVRTTAGGLLASLAEAPDTSAALPADPHLLTLTTAHLARPALVFADYLASVLKTDEARPLGDVPKGVLANTRGDGGLTGDSLATHLASTARHSSTTYNLLRNRDALFRSASLPADSPALQTVSNPRFKWQQEAADQVAETVAPLTTEYAFFGVVVSSTGAGKTVGGVRIMNSATRGNLRYSLALSTRALTLQSGRALRQKVGLSSADAAVAVGGPLTLALEALASQKAPEQPCAVPGGGSDALAEPAIGVSLEYTGAPGPWRELLAGADEAVFGDGQRLDLIDAPVLIATIDHLIRAVELVKSSESLMSLRLMTSDLVLDEIDNYSARDLVSLGKLVFATALYGRQVLIMSATLSPAILEGLWSAFEAGKRLRDTHLGMVRPCVTAFVSDRLAPLVSTNLADLPTSYGHYIQEFVRQTELTAPSRRQAVWSLPESSELPEHFESILAAAVELHGNNHECDSATGKRFSSGFVRFNTAKQAWRFARYLASRETAESEPTYRVLTYHAKQSLQALSVIDGVLNRVMDRTASSPLSHPEVRTILEADTADDVLLIVSTTTLQETGRDHDYDWAVLEPRSVKGEIQAAGRVRRHRPGPWGRTNVFILSSPLRALTGSSPAVPVWGLPGVERVGSPYRISRFAGSGLRKLFSAIGIASQPKSALQKSNPMLTQARDVLPVQQWDAHFSAGTCLLYPQSYESNRVGATEMAEQYAHLIDNLGEENEPVALMTYLSPDVKTTPLAYYGRHATETRFRQNDGRRKVQVFFNTELGDLERPRYADDTAISREHLLSACQTVQIDYPERFWLPLPSLMAQAYADSKDSLGKTPNLHRTLLGCELELPPQATHPEQFIGRYNPYLGFLVGK
jgi:CRISPR-associated endonuclease/helicase Cas3